MDWIALREREKYTVLWEKHPEYREKSSTDLLTPVFLAIFKDQIDKGDRVIDFGCGTGKSSKFLTKAGLDVFLVDFCENCLDIEIFIQAMRPKSNIQFFQECLWDLTEAVKPSEWIICFDVLEHIPEGKVDWVLEEMASRMKKGGLLHICLREDICGELIGDILHVTVKPENWWLKKIDRHFVGFRKLLSTKDNILIAVFSK